MPLYTDFPATPTRETCQAHADGVALDFPDGPCTLYAALGLADCHGAPLDYQGRATVLDVLASCKGIAQEVYFLGEGDGYWEGETEPAAAAVFSVENAREAVPHIALFLAYVCRQTNQSAFYLGTVS